MTKSSNTVLVFTDLKFLREEAEKFLSTIWFYPTAGAWYELRIIGKRTKILWCREYKECLDALQRLWEHLGHLEPHTITAGILPRENFDENELGENMIPLGGGKKKHVERGQWLWADNDFKQVVRPEELSTDIYSVLEEQGYYIVRDKDGGLEAYIRIGNDIVYINKPSHEEILQKIEELKNKGIIVNIVVDSGFGYHFYSQLTYDIDIDHHTMLERLYAEIAGNDPHVADPARTMRLPGTPNTKYPFLPRYAQIIYMDLSGANDPEKLLEIMRQLTQQQAEQEKTIVVPAHRRELGDKEIRQIIELLKPYWFPGHRQNLELYLSGFLWWKGIGKETFRKIIDIITVETEDEQRDKRLKDVDYLWGRAEKQLTDRIAGRNYLINELEKAIKEKKPKISDDDARDEAIKIVEEIEKILRVPGKDIFIRIPYGTNTWFVNDPRRGIILLRETTNREGDIIRNRKYISTWYIYRLQVIRADHTYYYKLGLRNARTKEKIVFAGTMDEITKKITNMHGVQRSKYLRDALSSLITEFIRREIAKIRRTSEACGIYYSMKKDRLKLVRNAAISKLLIPVENDIVKARHALELLKKIRKHYDTMKFDIALNWATYAPISYVLKKHYNIKQYYLFLHGEKQTGKTTLARIIKQLFPVVTTDHEELFEEALSDYRLSYMMNLTTFPVLIDEVEGISEKHSLLAMLKRAATSTIARWRGDINRAYHARAALMFTSNRTEVFSDAALIERLILLEFDHNDYIYRKPREKLEEFKYTYNEYLSLAPWLGKIIIDTILDEWDKIKEKYIYRLHEKSDAIDMGRYIWNLVAKKLGVEIPWTKTIVTRDEIDERYEELERQLVFELIQDIIRDTLLRLREPLGERTLAETIQDLYRRGYLPSYLKVKDDTLVVTGTIIRELQKRYGIKPIGGIKQLASRLGYVYKPYRIGRTPVYGMGIPLRDLDHTPRETSNDLDEYAQDLLNEIIHHIEADLEQSEKIRITRDYIEKIMHEKLGMDKEDIGNVIDKILDVLQEYYKYT